MPERLSDVPARVLAVYAHPADAEIACGATLAHWAASGSQISLVVCTRGDKGSHDPDADPVLLSRARADEVGAAAEVLGLARHEVLDHPDGEVENDARFRRELVSRIRAWRPDVVLGHDPTAVFFGDGYVNHRDHRVVGYGLLDAVAPAAASPLYFPDAGPAHRPATLLLSGTLEPDTYLEVEPFLASKAEAVRCHRSQLGANVDHVEELVGRRAAEAGAVAGVVAAESFRRIHLA